MAIFDESTISSPKRGSDGAGAWYDYYAGYSVDFVSDVLAAFSTRTKPSLVLDPWNGSGTTTAVAANAGHASVGMDLNPALVTIAKARHLSVSSLDESLQPLRAEIISLAKSLTPEIRRSDPDGDELASWFTPTAAARLRALERATHRILVDEDSSTTLLEPTASSSLSSLSAFYYCALFTITRKLTSTFRSSNPTWVRRAKSEQERVEVSWATLDRMVRQAIDTLASRLTISAADSPAASLTEGSVETLTVNRRADLVLTSPPYCTRIDYVVATRPELALLGLDASDMTSLRKKMLGSPLTKGVELKPDTKWGEVAVRFLRGVHAHDSKAAQTYYYRYYLAYLNGLSNSLERIDRATKRAGTICLVVQDSYFKDIHFDLPAIVAELGVSQGRPARRLDFPVQRTKAAIHPASREYRDTFEAVESLVILEGKGSDGNRS